MSSSLTLDNIRSTLIRQEDSIIFTFIERAQFAANPVVYQAGGVQVPGALVLPSTHACVHSQPSQQQLLVGNWGVTLAVVVLLVVLLVVMAVAVCFWFWWWLWW
jgi:hypothetical protein